MAFDPRLMAKETTFERGRLERNWSPRIFVSVCPTKNAFELESQSALLYTLPACLLAPPNCYMLALLNLVFWAAKDGDTSIL